MKEGKPAASATVLRIHPPRPLRPGLAQECERSRALAREACQLVAQARALRAEIAVLVASWPAQVQRARERLRASGGGVLAE